VSARDINGLDDGFAIDLQPGLKSYFIEGVIDHEGDGTLIGIEILGLLADCGGLEDPGVEALQRAGLASVSIDPDADAIYLRVRSGRATHQAVRQAVVILDEKHRLWHVHLSATR